MFHCLLIQTDVLLIAKDLSAVNWDQSRAGSSDNNSQ